MSKVIQVARAGGIHLSKQGSKYRGLCCFHAEHHASMWLDPTLDSFHCFGCGASGGYVKLAGRLGVDPSAAIGPPSPRHPLARHVVADQNPGRLFPSQWMPRICRRARRMSACCGIWNGVAGWTLSGSVCFASRQRKHLS